MIGEGDDILHGDLVVEFPLILGMLEAEAGIHDVVRVELAEGCVAKKGADIAVLELAAYLLEDDSTLVQG